MTATHDTCPRIISTLLVLATLFVVSGDVYGRSRPIRLDGQRLTCDDDEDTYLVCSTDDEWQLWAGDSQIATLDGTALDWTGELYVTGNVGVGTTSPEANLELRTSAPEFRIDDSTTVATDLQLGSIYWAGNKGGQHDRVARISARAMTAGTWSAATNDFAATQLEFYTQDSTTTDLTADGNARMIIDSAGEVGIGVASPSTMLDVAGNATVESQANVVARFRASTGASSDAGIMIGSTNGNLPFIADADGSGTSLGLAFYTTQVERMRIEASTGNVGIGASPSCELDVQRQGTPPTVNANTIIRAVNAASASNTALIEVISGNTGIAGVGFGDTDSSFRGYMRYDQGADEMQIRTSATEHLTIDSGGEVYAINSGDAGTTTTTDLYINASTGQLGANSSIAAVKKNIRDMEDTSWLYDVRPINFEYIDNPTEKAYGLLAEELESVRPEFVTYKMHRFVLDDPDITPPTPAPGDKVVTTPGGRQLRVRKGALNGINYSRFIPVLINEIQKQQAVIQTLEARISALEAAP